MFEDKSILITGGTGSFGNACVREILARWNPRRLIVFSRDELKQFEMQQALDPDKHPCLRFFLGDVRDRNRLYRAFQGVDYVIHAAALKQVPAAEYNPFEAVQVNVLGAQNVIDAAIDQGVSRVIAMSTDKAVSPINLYGATKLCSDKLFIAGNFYAASDDTMFSVVRYGNVVGSRGSVIPTFLRLRDTGTIPVTDPRMTRFWITLQQGVDFVLNRLENMNGGEIFVPKIPSMSLLSLAKAIAPECETKIVGIRPGEKLHELLITRDDARNVLEFDTHYVILPPFKFLGTRYRDTDFQRVEEDFEYSSETNPEKLTDADLQAMVAGIQAD